MRDRPDGPTLAAYAREAAARGDDRALVARALAIAEREAAAGEKPLAACRAALAALYGEGALAELLRRFVDDIGAGRFDAPSAEREAALSFLWAMTRQKLGETNPDYLAAAGV